MLIEPSATVLLVEDHDTIREVLAEALELAGYTVEAARDGFEALGRINSRAPAAIVLDLMLPGMNGWDFIDAVRQIPSCFHTQIMVISASYALDRRAAGLRDKGVQAILAKPFDLDAFLGGVERLITSSVELQLSS